ncbi:malate dehydrogenase [Rhodococcus sp. IEGM 1366]|uniref:malate dehydrogenase n=1 Tax=Rhodococcus sp. IEGM 1366 TaxID=3082223 RepID=UPI00295472B2|nr:malate dehydrogenase [Rhodococcus sp. IEGM 1366]MDV8070727.1 malate dehydrogenase [Rhodococcus sp. IEGM 1366]
MTVFGVSDVESAASNTNRLVVAPRDIVTPLARELARERGVAIEVSTNSAASQLNSNVSASSRDAMSPSEPVKQFRTTSFLEQKPPAYLDPPSPALYRRGGPLNPAVAPAALGSGAESVSSSRRSLPGSGRVEKVVVVGAGHVGMITALKLAEADAIDEVVLVDINEGLAAGVALDLTHVTSLLGVRTKITGVGSIAAAGRAEYVVITAGRARQPGMTRGDLVTVNAEIVGVLAKDVARTSPDSVILVVTNPLDEMTHHVWAESGFPPGRVLGMAGVLDSARFEALAALSAGVSPTEVSALALGSHGDEMVIPLSLARIGAKPITQRLEASIVDGLVDRARNSGAEVVGLLGTGSAFFAPGASAAKMVLAMASDSSETIAATVRADGQYGITGTFVGLPVQLGRKGLRRIVELPLAESEHAQLKIAAEKISARVADLDRTVVRA